MIIFSLQHIFTNLAKLEELFFALAVLSSIGLIIQILFAIFTGGLEVRLEIEDEEETPLPKKHLAFSFITLKNFIAFVTGFCWCGFVCIVKGLSPGISIVVSGLLAILFTGIFSFIFHLIERFKD